MKKLQALLTSYIKKLSSDLHSAIVGIILVALFLSIGGIYLFAKKLWISLKNTILSPTPLWVTITLVFLILVYIYLKTVKTHSPSQLSNEPNYTIKYFTIGQYRWKTKIYTEGGFKVDEYPLCVEHDLQFIYNRTFYRCCPEKIHKKCNSYINEQSFFTIYESAKSKIDKLTRNKEF